MTLPGIADACYSLAVFNADATGVAFGEPAASLVWEKADLVNGALCSSQYGDGAGSLSFVGTCDASANTAWIQLSLDTMLADAGGSTTPLIEGQTVANGFINPCPDAAPCVLSAPCDENADTPVEFNLTVMRAANQGFFDIAVSFEDIFCSAKLDCGPVDEDIELLFNDGGGRDMTVVLAVTCTGGPDETEPTHLYMNDVELSCTGAGYGATVDPSGGPGNVTPTTNDGDILFGAAVYRGDQQLAGAAYWNVALGLNEAVFGSAGDCTITTRITASAGPFDDETSPADTSWPVIDVDVLAISGGARVCTFNPLNGGGSGVTTEYTALVGPGETFDHAYAYGSAGVIDPCAPESKTWVGELAVTDPADLPADYGCLEEITGGLRLQEGGHAFGDLVFENLTTVGGTLILNNLSSGPADVSFPALTSVGGAGISIAGSATIAARFGALETLALPINFHTSPNGVLALPVLTTAGDIKMNGHDGVELQAPALATANRLEMQGNSNLTTISVPLLETVTSTLHIQANYQLTTLDLPSLTTVGTTFQVVFNQQLSTCAVRALLDGLSAPPTSETIATNLDDAAFCPECASLTVHDGNIDVGSPGELPADHGCIGEVTGGILFYEDSELGEIVFANLTAIGSHLEVEALESGTADLHFPALTSVGGDLRVGNGAIPALRTLSLPELQTITGGFHVDTTTDALIDAPQLTSAGQLELTGNTALDLRLPALQTLIGQLVYVGNPGMTEIALPALESVGDQVYVESNADLTALSLGALRTVTGRFAFTSNTSLSTCAIQAVRDALTTDPPMTQIEFNGPCD